MTVINPIAQFKAPMAQRIKKKRRKKKSLFRFSRLLSSNYDSHPDLYPELYSFWTWCIWHSLWWLLFKWLNTGNYLSQNTCIFLFIKVMKVILTKPGGVGESVVCLTSHAVECNWMLFRISARAGGRDSVAEPRLSVDQPWIQSLKPMRQTPISECNKNQAAKLTT